MRFLHSLSALLFLAAGYLNFCPRTNLHSVVSARAAPLPRHAKPPTPVPPSPPHWVLYYRWREPNPAGDGEVLRISTEKPLETTEDSVDRSRDDSVDRRHVNTGSSPSHRFKSFVQVQAKSLRHTDWSPPDEFQVPPQRVPEPVSLASRINPEVPVSESEMEELSDTLMNPSPAEVNDERGNDLADQVSLTENEAGQSRDDMVERRQVPTACRADPPDEFQFPPEKVPELSDQTSRTYPVGPIPEPDIEDLSDTPTNLPPAETSSEDGGESLDQVDLPSDTGSDEWADWDEYSLRSGPPGDVQPPENRLQLEKKRKMKEKGEYTKKRRRGVSDTTESESGTNRYPLRLVQPSDQGDVNYRPYRAAARERTANRRGRATAGQRRARIHLRNKRVTRRQDLGSLGLLYISRTSSVVGPRRTQ